MEPALRDAKARLWKLITAAERDEWVGIA